MKMLIFPSSFLLLSGLAVADPGMDFQQLDQNQDGRLTPDEVVQVLPIEFAAADKDGNGILDEKEFAVAMNPEGKEGKRKPSG